ncbi:MAG: hypothetical protein OXI43_02695 [Candidatus Poribacteria bacterium]|nr:hypothetical protein [Candidatus Poribacteria bacterium]
MGSRSYIGYLNEDGNVTFSYCHRGSQLKYNGRTLLTHFNDEKSAKALAYHGEMASIDGDDGRISEYKNPDTPSTVSLHAYLAWSELDIQSLYIWMHGGWQIKSDYHLDNDKWHVLRDLVFEVGDKVNLVRDNYITSHPRPVWEVRNITQPDDAEIDVYVLRREVLPAKFVTEHMRYDEMYRCPPTAENPQTPAPLSERQKDLQARINKLCELSAELELHDQKLMDDNSEVKSLEQQYQDLFRETLLEFGN